MGELANKVEVAKAIIGESFDDVDCGIFDSRIFAGDPMVNVYDDGELQIDFCYYYSYVEVFGLTDEEFNELEEWYHEKRGW